MRGRDCHPRVRPLFRFERGRNRGHRKKVLAGTVIAITYPSPLTSCPGYKAPTGLPLIVQVGAGADVPRVTHSAISDGTRWLHHCVFDESTYRNRSAVEERLGRTILGARDAIVLIPREPIEFGSPYRVQVEVNGQQINWTFGVQASAPLR